MAEDLEVESPEIEEIDIDESAEEEKEPLGKYAPFDVSDEKEWTKKDLDDVEGDLKLPENIRSLVVAALTREALGRRLEVSQAWRLELADRGLHRIVPDKRGGWNIAYQNDPMGIFGGAYASNLNDLNVIGVKNDIIVASLTRDIPKTEFSARTDDDRAVTAASAANKIKWFVEEDCCFKENQGKLARAFCTDERAVLYMRPVADAQRFGYEDDAEDVVPETEETTPATKPSKRPRIQTVLDVFGKLEHKTQIACDDDSQSPYQILMSEYDTAALKAEFPWICKEITPGDAGVAQVQLDRVARASIKLAIHGRTGLGPSFDSDTTKTRAWITPKFYWEDNCSEEAREWLLENFPKGFLAVYAGTNLAFVRNEAWTEVLTICHARTGKGQNRRAVTEAYIGANTMLNTWIDLINKFFTSTVPRVFLDDKVFNVQQIRQSGNAVGRVEPFNGALVQQGSNPLLAMPMPTHQPALPQFIQWFAGPLADLLTGAEMTLSGSEGDTERTLGESEMDNNSALTRLSEPWSAICRAFSNAMQQAVEWNARVQPVGKVFDRIVGGQGRIRVEMVDLDTSVITITETSTNFPESWEEREERVWQMIQQMPANPYIATLMAMPSNAKVVKDAARMNITIPGASSWEKQEGEFALLTTGKPQQNPKVAELQLKVQQLKQEMENGAEDVKQRKATGQQIDPKEAQMLQRGLQMIQQLMQQAQQLPPLVSSVPVRGDGSEEDAIEQACCLQWMISPEGRRMANSHNPQEKAAFMNVHLHWAEHKASAENLAKANQQPVEPKASLSVQVDKLPGEVQSQLFSKMDINVPANVFNEMGPHEVEHSVEGVNPQGAKEKVVTKLAGKKLD